MNEPDWKKAFQKANSLAFDILSAIAQERAFHNVKISDKQMIEFKDRLDSVLASDVDKVTPGSQALEAGVIEPALADGTQAARNGPGTTTQDEEARKSVFERLPKEIVARILGCDHLWRVSNDFREFCHHCGLKRDWSDVAESAHSSGCTKHVTLGGNVVRGCVANCPSRAQDVPNYKPTKTNEGAAKTETQQGVSSEEKKRPTFAPPLDWYKKADDK